MDTHGRFHGLGGQYTQNIHDILFFALKCKTFSCAFSLAIKFHKEYFIRIIIY